MNFIIDQLYEYTMGDEILTLKFKSNSTCKITKTHDNFDDDEIINLVSTTNEIENSDTLKTIQSKKRKINDDNIPCYYFENITNLESVVNFIVLTTDTYKLNKIKVKTEINFDKLEYSDVDFTGIEIRNEPIFKKLFTDTYPGYPGYSLHKKNSVFHNYSSRIRNHNFKLSYIVSNGNTYIDPINSNAQTKNFELLQMFKTTPKAESDFIVFRKTYEREGYNPHKIINREVTTEKYFGSISTSLSSQFAINWNGDVSCCLYLIYVNKSENYLILDDVFIKDVHENLILNNDTHTQYEVALAPGIIHFLEIKKVKYEDREIVLFICRYQSFTESEFHGNFNNKIFESKYIKRYQIKYD
jgi:hypothetical protein